MQKTSFLLLIIYILFSSEVCCQNLQLKIDGNSEFETRVIDSLNYLKNHKDYSSIKFEVNSLRKTLSEIGYIENELKSINKINDTTFYSQIDLKKKFNTIYIYYDKSNVDTSILNFISKNVLMIILNWNSLKSKTL